MKNLNRRNFIKKTSLSSAAILSASSLSGLDYKDRDSKSNYMGDFAAPKIDNVKAAFIGVGARGTGHAKQIAAINGTGNFLIQGTGSLQEFNVGDNSFDSYLSITPSSVTKDLFLVKSGSFSAFEVNDKGVMNLGGFTEEPTVVEGGFYYNTDENEFYLGTG